LSGLIELHDRGLVFLAREPGAGDVEPKCH